MFLIKCRIFKKAHMIENVPKLSLQVCFWFLLTQQLSKWHLLLRKSGKGWGGGHHCTAVHLWSDQSGQTAVPGLSRVIIWWKESLFALRDGALKSSRTRPTSVQDEVLILKSVVTVTAAISEIHSDRPQKFNYFPEVCSLRCSSFLSTFHFLVSFPKCRPVTCAVIAHDGWVHITLFEWESV